MGTPDITKKRKRTQNTIHEQYEIYANFLENDYIFRSGIINPSVEDDYIKKKWVQLANLLNSCGNGPQMKPEEWKKRFADWKYAVRAKARRILNHKNQTGSGPQIELKLNSIEEKVLSLWGKVVVTGTPFVGDYDGLHSSSQQPSKILESHHNEPSNNQEPQQEHDVINEFNINEMQVLFADSIQTTEPSSNNEEMVTAVTVNKPPNTSAKKKYIRHRPKPLSTLAEKLITLTDSNSKHFEDINNSINKFCNSYIQHKNDVLKLKSKKLSFQIAKYKFENPSFSFDN